MELLSRPSINTDNIINNVNERKHKNKKITEQSNKLLKAAVGWTNTDISWKYHDNCMVNKGYIW